MSKQKPSVDLWLQEAKADASAANCGMYLIHNGTVRQTARAAVREGVLDAPPVTGMTFGYDAEKVAQAVEEARSLPGIGYVRVWLNEGELALGDDIMLVLIGGDIRPHVVDALQHLVGAIKTRCVTEQELH
ncbi:MAG: molybdenum cofactor biosynthesis protein MoaE [Oscillospiraceae bacterium]|nr:molybdenum cofactor biosynthesis protein MoaE [Oscillospiraceae bacterium]